MRPKKGFCRRRSQGKKSDEGPCEFGGKLVALAVVVAVVADEMSGRTKEICINYQIQR